MYRSINATAVAYQPNQPRSSAPNHIVIGQHGQPSIHFQDKGNDLHIGMQGAEEIIGLDQTEEKIWPEGQMPSEVTWAEKRGKNTAALQSHEGRLKEDGSDN